jgi:hypothetical protein
VRNAIDKKLLPLDLSVCAKDTATDDTINAAYEVSRDYNHQQADQSARWACRLPFRTMPRSRRFDRFSRWSTRRESPPKPIGARTFNPQCERHTLRARLSELHAQHSTEGELFGQAL